MADQGNDFEGCSERACQQLGEAGVLEEGDHRERLPNGAADREPLRQLGQEGYPWHQASSGTVESHSGQQDPGAHPELTGYQLCGLQAWAPFGKVCSDQLPGPF